MPRVSLTDLLVQRIKPPERGQIDYWDASLPSFGVRVSKGGSKTFVVLVHGNRKSIGRYPVVSLKKARDEARRVLYEPATYAQTAVLPATYQEAVDRYLTVKAVELRPSTLRDYKRLLSRFDFPLTIDEIRPYQVADALDRFTRQTDKSLAFTVLKVFFGWCVAREYCRSNPMQNLKKPKLPAARERVLFDDELVAIWNACDELGKYGVLVRILLVTGQRAGQIARLRASWIKDGEIHFPASVMKNKREHVCPIGNLAKYTLLNVIPVDDYYFSPVTAVGRPFSAWSKSKAKLDSLVQLDPWRLHDLRRTWSTNAPRLDIPPHITARILSHVAPEGGIAKVYNRYKYRQEMADAMTKMEDHILSLLQPVARNDGSTWA
jgi:integrase